MQRQQGQSNDTVTPISYESSQVTKKPLLGLDALALAGSLLVCLFGRLRGFCLGPNCLGSFLVISNRRLKLLNSFQERILRVLHRV